MRCFIVVVILAGYGGFAGCTQKGASDPPAASAAAGAMAAAPTTGTITAAKPVSVPSNASPDRVVTVFLDALRVGDSPTTESLLTAKAREELAKHSLSVDVQSAPNAVYQVKPAEPVAGNPNGAHVTSIWTEKFDDGDETYEIVWALRRQAEGWRLAGMAMQLVPGQPVQFLNFEDPADMLRKKDDAIATLQGPVAETAQQPSGAPKGQSSTVER